MTEEVIPTIPTPTTAPAPVPAPEPAPAPLAPKPAPKPTPATEGPEAIEYEPTGDAGLDFALGFVGRAGISSEHPAMIAAQEGDFGLLKATLAQMGVPGWEQAVALGEQAVARTQDKAKETSAQVAEAVLAVAESAGADWEEAVVWAKANATEDEVSTLNTLFADPATAKIAAFYIVNQYTQHAERPAGKPAVKEDAGTHLPPAPGAPLTSIQFAEEAEKLYRALGNDYQNSPQYRQLRARRAGK